MGLAEQETTRVIMSHILLEHSPKTIKLGVTPHQFLLAFVPCCSCVVLSLLRYSSFMGLLNKGTGRSLWGLWVWDDSRAVNTSWFLMCYDFISDSTGVIHPECLHRQSAQN